MAVLAISLPETANNDEMNSFWHVDSLDWFLYGPFPEVSKE